MVFAMNRRDFLLRSSLLVSTGLFARVPLIAQPVAPTPGRLIHAGHGLPAVAPQHRYFHRSRGGTIGWLVNADALLAVDTQFPDTAALCLAGLPGREGRMLDAVINTHHHGDHTGGNGIFKAAARTIVAQTNVPRAPTRRGGAGGHGRKAGFCRPNLSRGLAARSSATKSSRRNTMALRIPAVMWSCTSSVPMSCTWATWSSTASTR